MDDLQGMSRRRLGAKALIRIGAEATTLRTGAGGLGGSRQRGPGGRSRPRSSSEQEYTGAPSISELPQRNCTDRAAGGPLLEPNPVAAVGLESRIPRTRIVSRADPQWREVGRDGSDSKFRDFARSALLRFRRLHGFGENLPQTIHRLWIAHPEPPRKRQEKVSRNSNIHAGHAEKNVVKSLG